MRRTRLCLLLFPLLLSGCSSIGDKAASISFIYAATALLSFVLLILCCIIKRKDPWFILLFICVLVVNIGYFTLSVSQNLITALWANRTAYLGSVFLPLSMLMIILGVTKLSYKKHLPAALIALGIVVFLIAASPGVLDIYYKEVSLVQQNGVSSLNKIYGPLHIVYLIYLLIYFIAMVAAIVRASLKNKIPSTSYALILATAVFVNIGVWLIEQLVKLNFEFLAVSYIISELFLLGLHMLMAENEKQKALLLHSIDSVPENSASLPPEEQFSPAQLELFKSGLELLTPKEREIYECYIGGLTSSQIMTKLNIKENTLKFHNKNLYGKLGVKSRKQLAQLYQCCKNTEKT